MPYSGAGDPTLPTRIKKLPAKKRRAFVGAFNSTIDDERAGESASERESRAFAVANAAANRAGEKAMNESGTDEEIGAKDGVDYPPVVGYEEPEFAAGAMTFSDYDRYRAEEQRQQALSFTFSTFQALLGNVMGNDEMSPEGRVGGMRALVDQLADRLDEVAADPSIAFKTVPEVEAPDGSSRLAAEQTFDSAEGVMQGEGDGGLTIFKDASGRYRWLAIHSNRYADRQKEIFPGEAHEDYVEWANRTKQFPPLRLWHAPFDIGPGDGVDYAKEEGFTVSTGTFYPGMESVARNLKAMSKERRLGCSHGFTYKRSDLRDGVYHRYRSFEVTVLPLEAAANLLTDFGVREALMLSPSRRKFFEDALGEEGAKTLEVQLAMLGQKAQVEGLAFKDLFTSIDLDTTPEATAASKEAPMSEPTATIESPAPTTIPAGAPATVAPAATAPAPVAAVEQAGVVPAAETLPTAADAATTAPLPPTLGAAAQEEMAKSFKDMISGVIGEALSPFTARLDVLEQGLRSLSQSKDAAIADAIRPAVGPTGAIPASLAASNVVSDAVAIAAVREASSKEIDDGSPINAHFKALLGALQSPGD